MTGSANLAALLGFDTEFDATAPETRQKTSERVGISAVIVAGSIPVIGLQSAVVWWAFSLLSEAWMWASTGPRAYGKAAARAQRLAASFMASLSWVFIGLIYWATGQESSRLLTVALMAGILLYVVKACYKNILHLLVCALPPSVCILLLPLSYRASGAKLATLEGAMTLLIGFTVNSAVSAHQHRRRLRATTRELTEKREAAEAASRAKSEFLANMSHEIRTPLNGVMGIAGALAQTRLSRGQQEMVHLIESSASNLQVLVSDILDLTRIESGRLELGAEPFEPLAAVRACGDLFRDTFCAKGLEFTFRADPAASLLVLGDAARLRQIVCNLLSNAAKFTEQGAVTLTLSAEAREGRVRLVCKVADTGIGFDEATKARLFERFEQADGSITRRYGGSGLGLAISRTLAKEMGGSLTAESDPGRGSCFTLALELPAQPAAAQGEGGASSSAAVPDVAGLRVLLAEDHPVNRRVVELILGAAGVALTCVENGAEAVDAAAHAQFDLILMDMQMPVMGGLEAIRLIRESGGPMSRAPIYTLTANALPEHAQASAAAGANGHVTKPITPAALLEAVRRAAFEGGGHPAGRRSDAAVGGALASRG